MKNWQYWLMLSVIIGLSTFDFNIIRLLGIAFSLFTIIALLFDSGEDRSLSKHDILDILKNIKKKPEE